MVKRLHGLERCRFGRWIASYIGEYKICCNNRSAIRHMPIRWLLLEDGWQLLAFLAARVLSFVGGLAPQSISWPAVLPCCDTSGETSWLNANRVSILLWAWSLLGGEFQTWMDPCLRFLICLIAAVDVQVQLLRPCDDYLALRGRGVTRYVLDGATTLGWFADTVARCLSALVGVAVLGRGALQIGIANDRLSMAVWVG